MNKNPAGACFIIACMIYSAKPTSKFVYNDFYLAYSQIENCHKNASFLSNYKKFWVLQNCGSII